MTANSILDYNAFLQQESIIAPDVGFVFSPDCIHHALYDLRALVEKSQQSLFLDTGTARIGRARQSAAR